MLNEKFLREIITQQIDNGKKHFIIFPFGTNGVNIKKCLEECFMIQPEMIVDNYYSKYNPNIIDFKKLGKKYEDRMTVLLTIENVSLNLELEKQLLSFVSSEQIVNFGKIYENRRIEKEKIIRDETERKRKKREEEKIKKQDSERENETYERDPFGKFFMENIIPQLEFKDVKIDKNEKIKVRFFHSEYFFWNSIKSICYAFQNDDKYDVLIIVKGEHEKEQMQKEKYSFMMLEEYDVAEDRPDILILSNVWDRNVIKSCRTYTKLIIAVPSMIIRHAYSLDGFWNLIRTGFERFHPDYYLFDSLLYEEIKRSRYFSDKIIEMGNAKFDGIYMKSLKRGEYPDKWKKLKGKKVIFWACDHGIIDGKISDYITFDLYAKEIFDYTMKHPEMGIIMRFHRLFLEEMIQNNCWSQSDIDKLRDFCSNTPNLVWDENDTYDAAYSIADAILTDALSGIVCSALPTLKPICMLFRNRKVRLFHPEFSDFYYSAYNSQELKGFFDMITIGNDPLYKLRIEMSKKYIKHFDGKNGERIKIFIENKYFDISNNPL